MAPTISMLARRGIPVMAHIGLMPQAMNTAGGFRAVRDESAWDGVIRDADAVAEAGAFAIVIEGVAEPLAARITETVAVPTIGIGASAACDGQILVLEDMLGLFPRVPSFVKRYGTMQEMMSDAIARYADDVRARRFPTEAHTYSAKKG
jgi:3-methyl-2-oxobutanoate hydroxymethyltransferase